ncbi:hypothetical protein QFZ54_003895 [Sphingomonas faeni]|nr:hypothetical protein [Sphingomonas faeni]
MSPQINVLAGMSAAQPASAHDTRIPRIKRFPELPLGHDAHIRDAHLT